MRRFFFFAALAFAGCNSTAGGNTLTIDYTAPPHDTTTEDDETDAALYGDGGGVDEASVPLPDGTSCGAAASAYVYVVGVAAGTTQLYAFSPDSATFHALGTLTGCPAASAETKTWPSALAVDREGNLSVLITTTYGTTSASGTIYPIDRAKLACGSGVALGGSLVPGSIAYGFAPTEKLFYAGELKTDGGVGYALASVDLDADGGTASVTSIGLISVAPTKISGTGDGRLFVAQAKTVAQIDPATGGNVTPTQPVDLPFDSSPGSAMAFYGGSLWFFESIGTLLSTPTSASFQYDPGSQSITQSTSVPLYVTGAGVSTCAPTSASGM